MTWDEQKIDELRCAVGRSLGAYRFEHVLSVEKEAARLA